MPPVQHFVRAEMLPSGYLIRPCEGGGSIIHIVDHMDLEVQKFNFFLLIFSSNMK
jgi:homeobox-leucine zipper protein